MTIERIGPDDSLKVVPIFLDTALQVPVVEEDEPLEAEFHEESRSPAIGVTSALLGVLCAALVGLGIAVADTGQFPIATVIAYAAIGVSPLAVVSGIVALVLRRGGWWAVAGIVLGVLANPLLLLWLLGAVAPAIGA